MKRNTKKVLINLLLVCMFIQVLGNAGSNVQAKDLNTWIHPIFSPDERESVSENEDASISANQEVQEEIKPEEIEEKLLVPLEKEESFVLGNVVDNILYVRDRVSDGMGEYLAKTDGIYYENNGNSEKISEDIAHNLNLNENFLFYSVTKGEETYIKKQNTQSREVDVILQIPTAIKQMYLVNNERLYYLAGDVIYRYDIFTGQKTKLRDGNNIFSFIVYKYGILVAEGNNRDYDLYVDDKHIDSHVRSYSLIDNQYLFYSTRDKVSKIDLEKKTTIKNVNGVITTSYEQELTDIGAEVVDIGALLEAVSMSPCESSESYNIEKENTTESITMPADVSEGQKNMVKNARQIVEIEWTCLKDVKGWRGEYTFDEGQTYQGIPYGQPVDMGKYMPREADKPRFSLFLDSTKDLESLFYTSYSLYKGNNNAISTYYACDCSALVSYAWNIQKETTTGLPKVSEIVEAEKIEYAYSVEVGDALIRDQGSSRHTFLLGEIEYDQFDKATRIRVYEQTDPIATTYIITGDKLESLINNSGYKLYRYKNRRTVKYNHDCAIPIDGDTCELCGPNVTFESDKVTVYIGYPQKIKATATPTDARITWKSSNTSIATIDNNGIVTGKKEGTVYISAMVEGTTQKCKVSVKKPAVTFTSTESNVYKGYTIQLSVDTAPLNTKVSWKSSDTSVATVDTNGQVKGIKKGTVKITASIDGASRTKTITVKNPTLKINKTSTTVYTGYTETIKATPTPSAEKVTWSTSDSSIATVNANGVVKGIKKGKVTITAAIKDSKKTCTVTIKEPTLTLNKTSMTVYEGYTGTIKATPTPSVEKVTWSTSDSSTATVNGSGVVKGIKKGKVTIKASLGNVTKSCTVTVKEPTVTIDKNSMTVYEGYTGTIKATPVPSNGKVLWTSNNTAIATVNSSGVVTGKKVGTVKITASIGKVSKTCTVTVSSPSVSLNKTQLNVYAGYTDSLTATTKPAGTSVIWKSSNTAVATVSSSGVITGKKEGNVIITASIKGASKQCSVTVKSPTLTINPTSMAVYKGYDENQNQIKATSTPAVATKQYQSKNSAIATVTENGRVKGVKAGSTKILVSIQGVTKECEVKVINPTLTISQTSMTLKKGKTGQLQASATPSYATITWSSSNSTIASVNSKGLVTAKKAGSVVITAKINGMSKICNVRITN